MAEKTTFDFPVSKIVKRHVVVEAPPQVLRAKRQGAAQIPREAASGTRVPVEVEAVAFSEDKIPNPPTEKVRKVIAHVIEFVVHPVNDPTNLLYEFDPPLTITIELAPEDTENALRNAHGDKSLFIFRCYRDASDNWVWATLPPAEFPRDLGGKPALSAVIERMSPNDPFGEGSP